jgi:AmmeMemoRadiSam system protein B
MAITKDKVRNPNVAGSFYEKDSFILREDIASFFHAVKNPPKEVGNNRIHAIISPHAGYPYCGSVMAAAYQLLRNKSYERVILIGPSHSVGFQSIAFDTASAWDSPLGVIPIDIKTNEQFLFHEEFEVGPGVFDKEHSLEVQLPFVQTVLPSLLLIPLCTGQDLPHKKIAETISSLISDSTIVVVSSDFSHYHPEAEAAAIDRVSIAAILSKNSRKIDRAVDACGIEGIKILNDLSVDRNWKPVFLDYRTSGDITGDKSAVVGYAAFAYV